MSDPYVGEIRIFAGNYAPEGWTVCDGKTLSVSQYQALFALIGKTYGGDGVSTFGVPDFRGRLPIGQGQGAGLTSRMIGQSGGSETVTLSEATIPVHNHPVNAVKATGTQNTPGGGIWASSLNTSVTPAEPVEQYVLRSEIVSPAKLGVMDPVAVGTSGTNPAAGHSNIMPSYPLSFIIALQGEYPQRSN